MRVINDRDEKTENPGLGVLALISHSLFSALGLATFFFAPMPMIGARLRLAEPWGKMSAVLGAVLALMLFEVSAGVVLVGFVVGMVVADGVARQAPPGRLLLETVAVSAVVGAIVLALSAYGAKTDVFTYWTSMVDSFLAALRQLFNLQMAPKRSILIYQGPFFFVSAIVMSAWVSTGFAAHLNWFPADHRYSGESLRKLRFPSYLSLVFLGVYTAIFLVRNMLAMHILAGVAQILAALMFIQGSIFLSQLLVRRSATTRFRTLVYSIAVLLGFYPLVGMGVAMPWLLKVPEAKK